MTFNTTAGKPVKAIVHNGHPYGVPGCPMISKTMTISNLVFELINDSLNHIVSSWKLRMLKVCPDEVHFRLKVQHLSLQALLNKETTHRFVFFKKMLKMLEALCIKHPVGDIQKWFNSLFWFLK